MNQRPDFEGRGAGNGAESDHASSRLCDLPDDILHSIMLLLPLNEAIRTCILGKRWDRLWRFMPRLNFQFRGSWIRNFDQFAEMVRTVRNQMGPQKLVLDYVSDDRNNHIYNALLMVMLKDRVQPVQEIYIGLSNNCPPSYVLPYDVFRQENLVRIELSSPRLQLPDIISLPRLQVLRLKFVKSEDGNSIQKLISSCPILEELTLIYCCWGDNNTPCTLSSPNLQKLFVRTKKQPSLLPDLLIECENLKDLTYVGTLKHRLMVSGGDSNKFEQAILGFCKRSDTDSAVSILNSLSSTRRLTLSGHSAEILGKSSQIPGLPQFDNMVELCIYGLKTLNITAQTLLRNSPSLQMLTIQGCWHPTPLLLYDLLDSSHLRHMKKITLSPHYGYIDFRFVGMLLRNCIILEDLVLRIRPSGVDDGVLDMVRGLDKVSEDCKIYTEYF